MANIAPTVSNSRNNVLSSLSAPKKRSRSRRKSSSRRPAKKSTSRKNTRRRSQRKSRTRKIGYAINRSRTNCAAVYRKGSKSRKFRGGNHVGAHKTFSSKRKCVRSLRKSRRCKYGRDSRSGKCRKKYGGNKGDLRRSRRDYGRKKSRRRSRSRGGRKEHVGYAINPMETTCSKIYRKGNEPRVFGNGAFVGRGKPGYNDKFDCLNVLKRRKARNAARGRLLDRLREEAEGSTAGARQRAVFHAGIIEQVGEVSRFDNRGQLTPTAMAETQEVIMQAAEADPLAPASAVAHAMSELGVKGAKEEKEMTKDALNTVSDEMIEALAKQNGQTKSEAMAELKGQIQEMVSSAVELAEESGLRKCCKRGNSYFTDDQCPATSDEVEMSLCEGGTGLSEEATKARAIKDATPPNLWPVEKDDGIVSRREAWMKWTDEAENWPEEFSDYLIQPDPEDVDEAKIAIPDASRFVVKLSSEGVPTYFSLPDREHLDNIGSKMKHWWLNTVRDRQYELNLSDDEKYEPVVIMLEKFYGPALNNPNLAGSPVFLGGPGDGYSPEGTGLSFIDSRDEAVPISDSPPLFESTSSDGDDGDEDGDEEVGVLDSLGPVSNPRRRYSGKKYHAKAQKKSRRRSRRPNRN